MTLVLSSPTSYPCVYSSGRVWISTAWGKSLKLTPPFDQMKSLSHLYFNLSVSAPLRALGCRLNLVMHSHLMQTKITTLNFIYWKSEWEINLKDEKKFRIPWVFFTAPSPTSINWIKKKISKLASILIALLLWVYKFICHTVNMG